MSAFLAVNSARAWEDHSFARKQDVPSPTTPRAITSSSLDDLRIQSPDESSPNTPTRQNFGGRAPQQTAHSDSPQLGSSPGAGTARSGPVDGLITRADSQRSVRSRDSQDVDMAISDDEQAASDNDAGADGDERPSKKKKGQRFYCTEFPPCTLSFTRSEHLARHIRYARTGWDGWCARSDIKQKAYRGAPVSVSLQSQILAAGQSTTARADRAHQRGDTQ